MNKSQHLPNLDGLRFLGALLVFVFHAFTINREVWGDFFESSAFQLLRKVTAVGHYGVNLFFVLSGFLITLLLLREIQRNGKINVGFFLIRRALRLWPLYFLLICFGFFIFPLLPYGVQTVHEFWRYALFMSNFDEIIHGKNDSLNFLTATWSVSVEEQFYIIWALIIGAFRFVKLRTFNYFFVLVILCSLVFRWIYKTDQSMLYYHSLSVISDMAIGGLAALWVHQHGLISWIQRLKKVHLIGIYLVGIAFLYTANKLLIGPFIVFERVLSGTFFAFILVEQLQSPHSFFKADKIPFFQRGGKLTYGFYLFHSLLIYYLTHVFASFHWTNSPMYFVVFFLLLLTLNTIISVLSYRYFESPLLQLKNKFRA